MAAMILELNDAGLRVQAGDDLLLDSPGFITVEGKSAHVGPEAQSRVKLDPTLTENQFWDRLGMDQLGKPNALASTQADLAYLHLADIWEQVGSACQDLVIVVPGDFHREQLGLLLGMCRRLSMPVRALLDVGVAASAAPVPGRLLYHLEGYLHRSLLTGLSQGPWLERQTVSSHRDLGLARLWETWSHAVAGLFVQATRFDPMHRADTEQWLYDHLTRWIRDLAAREHLDLELPHEGRTHSVRLHRRQLVKAAAPLYRRLREFIADEIPDDQPVTLQLSHRLAQLPGLVQVLENLPDVELALLDETATGNGVARMYLGRDGDGEEVAYIDRVPWFSSREKDAHGASLAGYRRKLPTHVLHQSIAYPLRNGHFQVGTAPIDDRSGIALDRRHVGVEANHFRLRREVDQVLLEDLSGGATVVNDDPVGEPVAVGVGDRIRIGKPGTEFLLIAVEGADGS